MKRREEGYVGKKDDGEGSARLKEKRKTEEKMDDFARQDRERVGAKEEDKVDQVKWKILSHCGDPE